MPWHEPIGDFKADRYLGTWYKIARLDHSFEQCLSNVTAEYSKKDDANWLAGVLWSG